MNNRAHAPACSAVSRGVTLEYSKVSGSSKNPDFDLQKVQDKGRIHLPTNLPPIIPLVHQATSNFTGPTPTQSELTTTPNQLLVIREWKKAMSTEIDSMMKNGVWDLVKLPNGEKPVGCKWVFKTEAKKEQIRMIPYTSVVVSLLYAQVCTHPDIAYIVGMLGSYQTNSGLDHWKSS
ncbi:hypothetical protein E3N88_15467 [Mikania micrantha]|uniref:Reverse transcriptase Ty1/copia-type domain-containing protein n=1 Tax=Mikania micrantha TaxID=192012 RepID=A0A5N6NWV4_9ASTR|nr:hypothetical protein E3N88_15467 [Mikania micrantha]